MEIISKTAIQSLPLVTTGMLLAASTAANAAVVINEIDYDQPGSDIAEFIELFNSDVDSITLDGYILDLINGSNGSAYRSLDLTGHSITADGYLVVCSNSLAVANCDIETGSNSWIQNGIEAVALSIVGTLIDSVAYEGIGSFLSPWAEGASAAAADSNGLDMSIARLPNGIDTNLNSSDFSSACLTPGSANIGSSGDCSNTINPVPIPAAAWLFGSGLLGLAGISRRGLNNRR